MVAGTRQIVVEKRRFQAREIADSRGRPDRIGEPHPRRRDPAGPRVAGGGRILILVDGHAFGRVAVVGQGQLHRALSVVRQCGIRRFSDREAEGLQGRVAERRNHPRDDRLFHTSCRIARR